MGDGFNDAPALTRANLGLAIDAETDAWLRDVVPMKSGPHDGPATRRSDQRLARSVNEVKLAAILDMAET